MALPLPDKAADPGAQRNFEALAANVGRFLNLIFVGSGSPNTVVTASPGAIYLNTAGGAITTLWVKESGSATNTGWVAK